MFDIGNKHYEFFDMLNQHAKYFNQGAKIMYDVMINYSKAQTKMEEIKTIEKTVKKTNNQTSPKIKENKIPEIKKEEKKIEEKKKIDNAKKSIDSLKNL